VRINRDGTIPPGNPSFGAGAAAGLWTIGLRNPQGAALHPTTGELWEAEHGPQGGDEINIARSGINLGWPVKSYGCPYGAPVGDACRIGGGVHAPAFVEPLTTWTPTSIAPSGLAFYTGNLMPEWSGNLFMGSLAGQALWRLVLAGDTVVSQQKVTQAPSERIRDVRRARTARCTCSPTRAPDGSCASGADGLRRPSRCAIRRLRRNSRRDRPPRCRPSRRSALPLRRFGRRDAAGGTRGAGEGQRRRALGAHRP
jgi:hypothetical protein